MNGERVRGRGGEVDAPQGREGGGCVVRRKEERDRALEQGFQVPIMVSVVHTNM